jgi:hypothetical protein
MDSLISSSVLLDSSLVTLFVLEKDPSPDARDASGGTSGSSGSPDSPSFRANENDLEMVVETDVRQDTVRDVEWVT